ncbi:hypothetical protein [Caballeronia sp. SBC2]|uniref:hypothetical protein n=1 Tax=Caballeronia sp. SBC2 TaxID=2705547 RepID=UPI0013E147AF|nr:hypothetical protein [Caballeronia sp. SBC2]QIE29768.1 hypothetical protein SBC2_78440 [Caballeronia sp. SBC2]
MRTEREQALTDNDFFEPLGFTKDAQFVRNKRFNSVLKLSGKINQFMLNQIAPLSFWRNDFGKTSKDTGLSEAREFLQRACAERGVYDEEGIAKRKLWNAKRAEQPAPVIAASGLPSAFIVKQKGEYVYVKCPFCGELHKHGGAELGARLPHCWMHYADIGNYELVRPGSPKKKAA